MRVNVDASQSSKLANVTYDCDPAQCVNNLTEKMMIKMIKTLILSLLVCLLLQLSNASAANYVLPGGIGSKPFKDCSAGPGPDTFTCTEKVDIGKNNTLVITDDVTLNIDGEFKVADDSSVVSNGYVFNVNATTLHIDGSASMVFTNLTASGNVTIHKNANLTANVTTTGGSLYIDDNSTVNGTCSPSDSQCTPLPSMVNPTVFSQTTTDTTPIIYGTYSSSVATSLTVMVNSVTYALSTSSELTNSSDNWTLDLSSITPLPLDTYNVVATSADADGDLSDTSNNELVIEEAQWWDTNWTKCRDITIANTGTTTLSNFPAYIDLAYDSDMQSNYYDIRFINTSCANSGSELDFEIETYTAASADVWVEIDSLPAAGKTIAVYYGNASATTGQNASGTWVSSHKGVWHLSESTNAENQDSTSNSNNGLPQNSPASTSGKIGKALDFDVGNATLIKLGTDDSLDLSTNNYPDWTISLWVKPFSDFGDSDYPIMYQYGSYGASVGLDKDNGKIEHWRNDDTALYNNTNLTTNVWNHVVVTRNSSTTTLYLNGNANGAASSVTIDETNFGSYIGGYPSYSNGDLKGLIDEVRVSNVVRTPDWIKQSYDLVQDQNDHVTIGDEVEAQLGPRLLGNLNVDNRFEAYISTDDSEQGTLLASGDNWETTYKLASSLLDGQEYYLHIKATNTGGAGGFLGDFELTDTSHRFSNGLTTLNTNTVNWSVNISGWSNYEPVTAHAVNGGSPWGTRSGVNASAQWIWSSDNSADNTAYFSTKIVAALPVLEYRFDELSWTGTAGELIDSSINSLNGQSVGGTLSEDAQLCTGATFDGDDDHFVVPPISTDFSSGFSAMAWVDFGSNNNWERIFDFGNGAANNNIVFTRQGSANHLLFEIFNGSASCGKIQANNGIVSGRHHYAVAVASDNTVVLYRDGVAIKSGTTACLPPNVTRNSNYIGRSNWNNEYFESEIDELKVFDSTLTATNISNIYNNEIAGNNYDGNARTCPTPDVNHYRIEHDTQGFTCEAEAMIIKACADANCDTSYDQEATITLSDLGLAGDGWMSGNEITIPAGTDIPITLSITDERSVNFSKTSASPNVDLRCFNGSTETCDMTFSNDGFELYGANIGDSLPDQKAADNFQNVNLRAVRSNNNVCEALLQGTQNIDLTYDCDSPDQCLTPLSGIAIDGDGSGGNTGTLTVLFDALGVANLSGLNYPDAGRLTLSVQAEVDGVTFNSSDSKTVDVYPSYLQLTVDQSELLYGSSGAQNNYIAGEPFTVSIGAYGTNNALLPNYQAENPQLKVTRIQPASSGSNGHFKYSDTGINSTSLASSFATATGLGFSAGEHKYTGAYYDEVGRINIDVKDNSYLGNEILSNGSKTLGDFYPAYFDVAVSVQPTLADTCGVFSYIGETIGFATNPELTVTAYNALDQVTDNYSDTDWNYLPDESTLEANLSYLDSSTYTATGTASEIDVGDAPVVTNNTNYDGSGTVTINNGLFQYNKVDTDNSTFDLVSPFSGSIDLVFANGFFTTTFIGQAGSNTVCYRDNYASSSCNSLSIENVVGTEVRYGRFQLSSTYGPENESLIVPIQTEYYDTGQWRLNTDDNCTNIDFDESASHIALLQSGSIDITSNINNITSTGMLLLGVADDGNDLLFNAPFTAGEVKLQLDPSNDPTGWTDYLNYDWNADGFIDANDHPEATITFGLFRGNDKIIHWREMFN